MIGVGRQIRFGEDDHRLSAAFPREREEPLDAAEVRLRPETFSDHRDVDVRRENLAEGYALSHPGTDEGRTPWQHRLDGMRAQVFMAGSIDFGDRLRRPDRITAIRTTAVGISAREDDPVSRARVLRRIIGGGGEHAFGDDGADRTCRPDRLDLTTVDASDPRRGVSWRVVRPV